MDKVHPAMDTEPLIPMEHDRMLLASGPRTPWSPERRHGVLSPNPERERDNRTPVKKMRSSATTDSRQGVRPMDATYYLFY